MFLRLSSAKTLQRLFSQNRLIEQLPKTVFSVRHKSEVAVPDGGDTPVKFTESKGFNMIPSHLTSPARVGRRVEEEQPWFQMWSIQISMASLLIYFCILREENDIDNILRDGSLYQKVEGLEEASLEASLKYNEETGGDTRAIRAKLEEIRLAKEQKNL